MNTALIKDLRSAFKTRFSTDPLIVFAPGRLNLIGEHTDYNNGFVFPAAIDKGIYAAMSVSKTKESTMVAYDKNEADTLDLNDLKPLTNGDWRNYIIGVCAEIQKLGKELKPFHLVFTGDIPKGAGLSSSAALENSVVMGLNQIFDLKLSKTEMIGISQKAEHNFVGVQCGIMDQYASMFGQEDRALLLDCRSLESKAYQLNMQDYRLILINSNVSHNLVEAEYNDRRAVCEKVAQLLGVSTLRESTVEALETKKDQLLESEYQKALYIFEENQRVLDAGKHLSEDNLEGFGKILYAGHKGASTQFKISCDELDFLVDQTKTDSEILGSRMMGGGFGGCTINIVQKDYAETFSEQIQQAYIEKFEKECSVYQVKLGQGAHLIN